MMITRNFLLILSGLLFFVETNAQPVQTLRGVVVDQVLQTPVAGATVTIGGLNRSAITDSAGKYKFSAVPIGSYTLLISHIAFKEASAANILVNSGKEAVVTIPLEPEIRQEQEIVLRADSRKNKPLNEMSLTSTRAFTVEETQRYAAAVNDPLRMATSFAGVVTGNDGSNDIAIRGNGPGGLLWRMEGVDIPNPNHFASAGSSGGGISILSSQLLANSDFNTGAFAAEYGNALSGVFDLKLRKGNNERREYTVQAGFLGLNVAAEGPMKLFGEKGSYLVNYRYSTLQLLSKMGVNIAGGSTDFQDLSYNIYIPTKKAGTFTLFGFGGLSSQYNDPERDSLKWENEGERYHGKYIGNTGVSAITHSVAIGNKSTLKSAIAYSGTETGYDQDYIEDNYTDSQSYLEKYRNTKLTVSSTLNYKLNNKNSFRAGGMLNFIGFNFLQRSKENPNAPLEEVINIQDKTQTIQAYAQWQVKPVDGLTFNTGMHYLQLLLNNSNSIDSRSAVKLDINRKSSIAAAYGHHSQIQPLGIYFAKTKNAQGQDVLLNKNLDLTKAHHFVLSYSYLVGRNLRLKAEAYYQHLYDVPISNSDTNTFSALNMVGGYETEALVNKGKGKNYGIELSLEKYLADHFYYMINTSVYQSKYTAADGIERNTRFNGNHVNNLVAGKDFVYRGGRRTLGLNIKLIYAGGFRTTPVDFEKSKAEGYTVYIDKDAYSLQNPDYFRADIRVSMTWNKKRATSTLSLDIQNVSNRQNIWARYYDPLKDKMVDDLQAGLIPVLNYKIEF